MKKRQRIIFSFLIILLAAAIVTSCGRSTTIAHYADIQADGPEFVEVQIAREELKTAIFGSQGWHIYPSNQSSYIYAKAGNYLLRYNILKNEIDRAVISGQVRGSLEESLIFTSDGEFAVSVHLHNEDFQYKPRNFHLIDFKNCKINLLAYSERDFNPEDIPLQLRSQFENNHITTGRPVDNSGILNYTVKFIYEEEKFVAYQQDEHSSGFEVTSLKGAFLNEGQFFVSIDGKTVGTIVSVNGDGLNLGYYKFVLIDIERDKITQECPVNTR